MMLSKRSENKNIQQVLLNVLNIFVTALNMMFQLIPHKTE